MSTLLLVYSDTERNPHIGGSQHPAHGKHPQTT